MTNRAALRWRNLEIVRDLMLLNDDDDDMLAEDQDENTPFDLATLYARRRVLRHQTGRR